MIPNRDAVVEIAGALRRQTREQRDFLIVTSDARRNYYVQFPHPGKEWPQTLYCEAVSDEWLDPGHELGQAGAARLRALGEMRVIPRRLPSKVETRPQEVA